MEYEYSVVAYVNGLGSSRSVDLKVTECQH